MLSYNVIAAAQQALRQRSDWMEQGQSLLLAVRITPTTVDPVTGLAAVRCPDCWDPDLHQTTVPDDPTCLGVGWIIPAKGGPPEAQPVLAGMGQAQPVTQGLQAGRPATAEQAATGQQGGYLNARPLPDAFINDQEQHTTWTAQGMASYVEDMLYASPGALRPEKGDVIIRTGCNLGQSRRYVVGDADQPKTLGSSILFYTAVLEERHADNVIFRIPIADTTGLEPGTWGE